MNKDEVYLYSIVWALTSLVIFCFGLEFGKAQLNNELKIAANTKIQNCLKIVGEIYDH